MAQIEIKIPETDLNVLCEYEKIKGAVSLIGMSINAGLTWSKADEISPEYMSFMEKEVYIKLCPECNEQFNSEHNRCISNCGVL